MIWAVDPEEAMESQHPVPSARAQGHMGEHSIQHTEGTEDMAAEWTGLLPSMHRMER